jgi:hypothetical protein
MELAQALGANLTLQQFSLHGVTLSKQSQKAFEAMLTSDNFTLQQLSLVDLEDDVQSEIDKFLLLNTSGRRALLDDEHPAGRQEWVEALACVSHELDCLFYLLMRKASLCEAPSSESSRGEDARERRRCTDDQMAHGKRRKTR